MPPRGFWIEFSAALGTDFDQATDALTRECSHQRALLEGNVATALAVLKTFGDELHEHIDYEEKMLLPLFAEEGGETEGATLEIFQAEHRKLHEQTEKLMKKTAA